MTVFTKISIALAALVLVLAAVACTQSRTEDAPIQATVMEPLPEDGRQASIGKSTVPERTLKPKMLLLLEIIFPTCQLS